MKLEKIQPGMVLYDRRKTRMGNTTMRSIGEWPVYVEEVSADGSALVSWNGNEPQRWYRSQLEKLKTWSMYDDCAEYTRNVCGQVTRVALKKGHKAPAPMIGGVKL